LADEPRLQRSRVDPHSRARTAELKRPQPAVFDHPTNRLRVNAKPRRRLLHGEQFVARVSLR